MASGSSPYPPLAPHYAFVVQYTPDTQIEVGRVRGRVEHVVSRYASHFESLEALLAFMAQVLRDVTAHEQAAEAEAGKPPTLHGDRPLHPGESGKKV